MTFEEFVDEKDPRMRKRYEISLLSREELIGHKVFWFTSGFSCGSEGREGIIIPLDKDNYMHDDYVLIESLTEVERSYQRYEKPKALCRFYEVPDRMILID
jgi:hypothetical protein